MAEGFYQQVRGKMGGIAAGEIRKQLITTGRSLTAIIEGILFALD
jgi:hypothetical protein